MKVTFHRAIDMTRNLQQACVDVIASGAHRILTSGGKQTALAGGEQIGQLTKTAGGKISIMAGSGINAHNAAELAGLSNVREFHASLRRRISSPVVHRNEEVQLGPGKDSDFFRYTLWERDVVDLRVVLDRLEKANIADEMAP
jgi:copper homeostasis protein